MRFKEDMMIRRWFPLAAAALALAGCKSHGDVVVDEGVGITAVRTACPAVGIPDYTGDITLFSRPGATDAGAIDVTAAMTDVRAHCDQTGATVHDTVDFTVQARRSNPAGARTLVLPFFVTVTRGGTAVIAKRIGQVTVNFADGQLRGEGRGAGGGDIDKASATLDRSIRERITRKRKAGEADAAVDPLAQPDVRDAVARASFEILVGFQLDDRQLAYNVTR